MLAYHDEEWGVPSHDDRHLYEMLTLEGAQAGLSWSTILRKRDGYRSAFAGFDPAAVARFTQKDVERLLGDPGIVRNRLKVESTIAERRACPRGPGERRKLRRVPLVVRRWRSHRQPVDDAVGAPGRDGPLPCALEGPEAPWLPLRRPNGLLRLHADGRHGRRPHRRLLQARVVSATMSARFTNWIAARNELTRSSSVRSVPSRQSSDAVTRSS